MTDTAARADAVETLDRVVHPLRRRFRRRHAAHRRPVHRRRAPCSATTWRRCPSSRPRSGRQRARWPASRPSRSHISDHDITTPGDAPNVLVAMNPAALKAELHQLEPRRDADRQHRHVRRAQPDQGRLRRQPARPTAASPATASYEVPMTSLTKEAVTPLGVKPRDAERSKNFFALGLISWMYTRPIEPTLEWIEKRFAKNAQVRRPTVAAFQAGLQLRRDGRAVRPPVRGQAGPARPGRVHATSPATPRSPGAWSPPASAPSCRCSSAATRSRRPPTSSTSCRSTRTSACARCRPRTRSPPSAPRSAPRSAATSASPPRAVRAWRSRARPSASPSASSCRCSSSTSSAAARRPGCRPRPRRPTSTWRCTGVTPRRRCRSSPPTARRTASRPPSRPPASR